MRTLAQRSWLAFLLLFSACGEADAPPEGPPTYVRDVRPILLAHCAPCHTTKGQGRTNHALVYADTLKDAHLCIGEKIYSCMLVMVRRGWMPRGKGCTGDPEKDAGNGFCLDAHEQSVLAAWVAAGVPEGP